MVFGLLDIPHGLNPKFSCLDKNVGIQVNLLFNIFFSDKRRKFKFCSELVANAAYRVRL
jgi:hypothetical protein